MFRRLKGSICKYAGGEAWQLEGDEERIHPLDFIPQGQQGTGVLYPRISRIRPNVRRAVFANPLEGGG
jgi:hypothetical protein